jgi:ankyrin repeat protein
VNLATKDHQGDTVLHLATSKGNSDIIQLLIDSRAPLEEKNNNDRTPLHHAIYDPNMHDLRQDHLKGWLYGSDHRTADFLPSTTDHLSIARQLLDGRANVNSTDKNGNTVLHLAAEQGQCNTLELFLEDEYHANIDARNSMGCRPFTSRQKQVI